MYKIFETDIFIDDLKNLRKSGLEKVVSKFEELVYQRLKLNPRLGINIKKLKGYSPDTWRYRIGDYRFFYEIDDDKKIVKMLAIDHRKDAY